MSSLLYTGIKADFAADQKAFRKQVKETYIALVSQMPRRLASVAFSWTCTHKHRCTDECRFFSYKDTSICVDTGHWHYCTQEECNRVIRMSDSNVCELTHNVYSMELVFDADAYAEGGPAGSDRYSDSFNAEPDVDPDEPSVWIEPDDFHAISPLEEEEDTKRYDDEHAPKSTTEIIATPRVQPHAVNLSQGHDKRMMLFAHLLHLVFVDGTIATSADFNSIIHNANRLWCAIQDLSSVMKANRHRYTEEYHLLAMLDLLKVGFRPIGHSVIPQCHWIRKHMPLVRNMDHIALVNGFVRVRNFTPSKKLLQECIRHMLHTQYFNNREVSSRLAWH